MKKNSKTRIGGGEHRSLNQQASGFTPVLGLRKSEILKKKIKAFTLAEVLIPKRVSGIDNKVRYSRASEIKAPFNLNKKLVAFTLAEVLITLAIIGVVAALTIPTVVAKYQKKQYYTQFMKVYNALSNAYSMAQAENGPIDSWGYDYNKHNEKELLTANLLPCLKVQKNCVDFSDCGINPDTFKVNYLNSPEPDLLDDGDTFSDSDRLVLILNDGSFVNLDLSGVSFDTNGLNKGPNTWGRDIFFFNMTRQNGLTVLVPYLLKYDSPYGSVEDVLDGTEKWSNCTMQNESAGTGCASRLLLKGKMDY